MGYKNISAIKAHLQIGYFECYKISFYGTVDFFNIPKKARRSNQLIAIKRILRSAKNGEKVSYYGETGDKNTRYTLVTTQREDYQFYDDLEINFDDD